MNPQGRVPDVKEIAEFHQFATHTVYNQTIVLNNNYPENSSQVQWSLSFFFEEGIYIYISKLLYNVY